MTYIFNKFARKYENKMILSDANGIGTSMVKNANWNTADGRVPIRIFYHTSSISIVICLLRAHLVRVPIHVVRRTILDKLASALDNYQVRSSAH